MKLEIIHVAQAGIENALSNAGKEVGMDTGIIFCCVEGSLEKQEEDYVLAIFCLLLDVNCSCKLGLDCMMQ